MSDISTSEIDDIRLGVWRLDCPKISLRGRGTSSRRYSGPGYIYQPSPGVLAFHMYSLKRQKELQTGLLDLSDAGEVLPEDAYFDFEAVDVKGRLWKSTRLLIDSFERSADTKLIITAPLSRLTSRSILSRSLKPKGNMVEIYSFQRIDLPWNLATVHRSRSGKTKRTTRGFSRDCWSFKTRGYEVFIRDGKEKTLLEVFSPKKRLPDQVETRFHEALEFVLGHEFRSQVVKIRRRRTIETIITPARADALRWHPPVAHVWLPVATNRVSGAHYQRLFDRFWNHGLRTKARVHSISGQLAAIREASAAQYIDAQALTLTAVVESLLLNDVKVRVKRPALRDIARLTSWIETWQGSPELKSRVLGTVAQLRSVRASDVLRALMKKGVVSKRQMEAWQRLRNLSSHQYQSKSSSSRLRDDLPVVQVLFYHLVFHVIGYAGPYTDYSAIGWPTRQYP